MMLIQDMTAYSKAVSNSNRGLAGMKGKKSIQVLVSKMFCHKKEPDVSVYAIVINLHKPFGTPN